MERLAQIVANKFESTFDYDEEKKQVVTYGLIIIIQIIITVLVVSILGVIFNTLIESLLICISVSLLRKYSGGAHVNSIEICTALSVIYCVGFSLLCKYVLVSLIDFNTLIVIIITVFILSFFAIYKLAPVDSPNKPIKTEKKRMRMRKNSFFVLTIYLIISIAFLIFGFHYNIFYSYLLSISLGILWQVFTLTKIGLRVYNGLNFISNKINLL